MSDSEETWGDWSPEPVPPPYVRPSLRRHTYRIWRAEGGAALETPGFASGEISRICQDGLVRAPGSLTMLRTPIGLDGLQDPSLEEAFPTPMPRALDLHDSGKVPFPPLEEVPTSSEVSELMTDRARLSSAAAPTWLRMVG